MTSCSNNSGIYRETVDKTVTRAVVLNPSTTVSTDGLEALAGSVSDAEVCAGNLGVYQSALQNKVKTQGPNHPSTLDFINQLGNLYTGQGKLKEAEELYSQALRGREKALGTEYPST